MVATTAFVLAFVALGLTTLFIAMGGGPKGARNALHAGASPRGSAVSWGIGVFAAIVGLGIPALILAHNSGAQEKQGPGGVNLTASEIRGRHLFAENCATCHTLGGANAVGKVGPNLDQMRPPSALVTNAIAQGRARGQGQMPALLLTGQDARDVAAFVAAAAGR
ncbi:MAG TPA: cytochrome c [Solirubrobacteraceae bacterium]|nr:cytochrome c [Solirubrobacteraceae bacterium]